MRIIEVDGEAAIIFPEEMISALGLKEGDTLTATPDDGGLKIAIDHDNEDRR